jgi:hypothetical protein
MAPAPGNLGFILVQDDTTSAGGLGFPWIEQEELGSGLPLGDNT